MPNPARDTEGAATATRFAHYEQTIIEISLPDGSTTSTTPGQTPPAALLALLPLYVITAWNPAGEHLDDAANHEAHHKMLELIRSNEHRSNPPLVLEAIGRARSGPYEVGVAVHGIARTSAVNIGQELRQDAIFEMTADRTQVVPRRSRA
jgi:hypothetical protein